MNDYQLMDNSVLKMINPNDYVYVNGQFFFETSQVHDGYLMNDGLIQVVGKNFKVLKTGTILHIQ